VRVKEVKIKAIRLKRAKAGAQLEPEKAFSMLRLGALILFRIFVALKLANRWRVRGRRNQALIRGTFSCLSTCPMEPPLYHGEIGSWFLSVERSTWNKTRHIPRPLLM
jgi:hypothetical protein